MSFSCPSMLSGVLHRHPQPTAGSTRGRSPEARIKNRSRCRGQHARTGLHRHWEQRDHVENLCAVENTSRHTRRQGPAPCSELTRVAMEAGRPSVPAAAVGWSCEGREVQPWSVAWAACHHEKCTTKENLCPARRSRTREDLTGRGLPCTKVSLPTCAAKPVGGLVLHKGRGEVRGTLSLVFR